ncbi:MAG TPA: hypothetical protein VFA44_07230 [Gaiellaceae bacterium]|nr:hypothetical protein [Gaiellaceae bacterium]
MPHWIVLLAAAAAGWLVLCVLGGLALGRGLEALERRRRRSKVLR